MMRRALRRAGLTLLPAVAALGIFGGGVVAGPGVATRDAPPDATPDAPPDATASLCAQAVAYVEDRLAIPSQLLSAIALAESGRWDSARGKSVSWPWTIYSEGHPHYPIDKKSAIAAVRSMKARGVRNIDVGCLQVNLFYHPNAFDDLDEAFDPAANTIYAGQLLLRLQNTHRSWSRAIAFYHSATRKYAMPYLRRVQRLWLVERRREAVELRDARIEALRMEKAERETTQAGDG